MNIDLSICLCIIFCLLLKIETIESKPQKTDNSNIKIATSTEDDLVYLQNNMIKLGINKSKGCGITYLASTENGVNVINHYDMGREIQASFYGGPDTYVGPDGQVCKWGAFDHWPWNPIACGDQFGNQSPILQFEKDDAAGFITCSITPLQWACNNIPCECSINVKYSLDEMAVRASVELVNNRVSDKNAYPAYDQEFPAVYTNYFLTRLVGYIGSKPWTNDAMSEFQTGFNPSQGKWVPGAISTLTEPYLIFATSGSPINVRKEMSESTGINISSNQSISNNFRTKIQSKEDFANLRDCFDQWKDVDFAVGVHNSDPRLTSFLGGYDDAGDSCKAHVNDPGMLATAGYIAPVTKIPIEWDEIISYEYSVVTGTFDTVRSKIYSMHSSQD